MLVFRIALTKYATKLQASGRAARWNPNEVEVIYTSSSRSLACLENVVHRSKFGLNDHFSVMTIQFDLHIKRESVKLTDLPKDWINFNRMPLTQAIGAKWVKANRSAVLEIPSSVIPQEINYLINPLHPDFKSIKLIKTDLFIFDGRIKS